MVPEGAFSADVLLLSKSTMNDVQVEVQHNEPTASTVRTMNMSSTNRRNVHVGGSNRQNPESRRSRYGFFVFQRQRHYFITRVYLLAIAFIALTMLQWVSIVSNPIFVDFLRERYYISLMSGLTALLFITMLAFFFEIRYIEAYNWIFAYIIVELETFALIRAPLDSDLRQLGICLLATIAINGIFRFIGIKIPRDLTQDILIIMVISLIFYVTASIILILLIATEMYFLELFLIFGTIFLLLVYIMYASQLIMGDRTGSLRWNDFILAALMVYFNFMLTLNLTLHLSNEYFY